MSAFAHTGALRYTAEAPRIPAFAISNPDADALERQFASGKSVRLLMSSNSRELPQARSANVIGEVPGTDRASEIVILGAHLDSWDPGVGAIDDGAGVAIMMAVAKLIQELDSKPRRTIRVVLFANEEFGTSGSQAYLAANQASVGQHVLGFEADFGAGPVWRLASRVNPAQLPAVDQIFRALAPLKLERGNNEARGGADLDGLSKLGMPILDPALDGTYYFDVHHTANDTLAKVDPAALRQAVAAYAISVWLGAQYPGDWERVPDAQCAASLSRQAGETAIGDRGPRPRQTQTEAGAGIRRRRCSACTWSRVRCVAAATELNTGCAALRGRLRPWVRSQARILASGALVTAVNSDNSSRRRSSACSCAIARRAR